MAELLTDSNGRPVGDNIDSITVGPIGDSVLRDVHLLDKLAHFDRERIPERVVHAKGAGAYGYFEVTHDVSMYTKAKFLEKVGKQTNVFVRFSTVGGEKGSADTARDPRGFAIKHYTEEGIYDMVGNNTPVFFIRDAQKFPDFIHTQKRHPRTNLTDHTMQWDFWSQMQESAHQVTLLFSPKGTPDGYRHMDGFSSHTFKWVNSTGEQFWVKLHYITDQGIKNLPADVAEELAGKDPDYATRDLYDAIDAGNFPSWTCKVQIMTYEQGLQYKYNIFDVTKDWPEEDAPLYNYGKLVLNRVPTNFFAEVEQSAFSPGNLVPGVEASQDKMLQGRLFSYHDTQRYRLGANFTSIPVNCPYARHNYHRDGFMAMGDNQGSGPNYHPNSFGGPEPNPVYNDAEYTVSGTVGHFPSPFPTDDDYIQPGNLYRKLPADEQTQLVDNIVNHMKVVTRQDIKDRAVAMFTKCDATFGERIRNGLEAAARAEGGAVCPYSRGAGGPAEPRPMTCSAILKGIFGQ